MVAINLSWTLYVAFSKGCSYEFSPEKDTSTSDFLFVFAFPRFPSGCWLALARCRRVTQRSHISGSLISSVLLSLLTFSLIIIIIITCHGLTIITIIISPCVGGSRPLSSSLLSLLRSQITLTLASVSSLLSLSGLTTNWSWLTARSV